MDLNQILLDEKYLQAAQCLIESAKRSIFISTFKIEITSKPRGKKLYQFFNTVYKKAAEGVDVRILINKVTKGGAVPITNLYAIQELPKHQVKVRTFKTDRICHAKIIIMDSELAILGSHNLSVKSCHNNFEVSFYTDEKKLVDRLVEICDSAWDAARAV